MLEDLERRIKRIEDELGITEREDRKKLIKDVTMLCINYGMTNHKARQFAWNRVDNGYTLADCEKSLIVRGAMNKEN